MKSELLLCLILSLSVACTSSSGEKVLAEPGSEASMASGTEGDSAAANPDGSEGPAPAAEGEIKIDSDLKVDPEGDAKAEGKFESESKEAAIPAPEPPSESTPDLTEAPLDSASAEVAVEKAVYPTSARLNLRRGPGKRFGIDHVIKFGSAIALSGERKKGWLKTTDGLWVASRYTSKKKPARVKHAPAHKKKASAAKAVKTKAPAAGRAPAAAGEGAAP